MGKSPRAGQRLGKEMALRAKEPSKIIQFNERLHQRVLKENQELKDRLAELIENARWNQQIQTHFDELERKIMKIRSLKEMARTVVREIRQRFGVDFVSICLSVNQRQPVFGIRQRQRLQGRPHLRAVEPATLKSALPKRNRGPVIRKRVKGDTCPFFTDEEMAEIRSHVIVPLHRANELIGTLNLGSRDPDRYGSGMATDFLRRLATKISLVMDNIVTHQRLLELSVTDQLTGISNRRHFEQILDREVSRAKRHGIPLACIVVDLDGFKGINDRHGHQAGDEALKHVAHLMVANCRRHDVVCRYGGDEFAILLLHSPVAAALRVADKFNRQLQANPFVLDGETLPLSLSMGVAAMPESPVDHPEDLVRTADQLLYRAKKEGGGQVVSTPSQR